MRSLIALLSVVSFAAPAAAFGKPVAVVAAGNELRISNRTAERVYYVVAKRGKGDQVDPCDSPDACDRAGTHYVIPKGTDRLPIDKAMRKLGREIDVVWWRLIRKDGGFVVANRTVERVPLPR